MFEFGEEVPKIEGKNHEKAVADAEKVLQAGITTLREVVGNGDWKAIAAKHFQLQPAPVGRLENPTPAGSQVNHPDHYNQGTLEVIDAIEGLQLGFHEGNALKYLARWRKKGGVVDLRKAVWYVLRLIEQEDSDELVQVVNDLLPSVLSGQTPEAIREQFAAWQATAERRENG